MLWYICMVLKLLPPYRGSRQYFCALQRTAESIRLKEKLKSLLGSAREGGRPRLGSVASAQVSPSLAKLLERVQAPSGRLESLKRAAADAPDHRASEHSNAVLLMQLVEMPGGKQAAW